jgi:hypothetical protein
VIPVIQFDPASLSLWYDAHLIAKCRGADELRAAIELAYEGRDEQLKTHINRIGDVRVRIRAANLASSVWHEKRHFLDFLITNYGALRIRQFFEIYRNLPVLLNQESRTRRILLPLDSNLDPLKREIFGIEDLDPGIIQLAESIERRKQMLTDDRRSLRFRDFGLVEVGGEGIMEAIAYHTKMTKAQIVLGGEIGAAIQADQPPGDSVVGKYKWAHQFLTDVGLLDATQIADHVIIVNHSPFFPLLYGALASRFWKQQQTRSATISSYLPGERLSSLVLTMRTRVPDYKKFGTLRAWQAVNDVAKDIFGRSILEEISTDIEYEGKYIEMLAENENVDAKASPMMAYREYHALRKKMFELLQDKPLQVLGPEEFGESLVSKLRPKVVVAASAGEIGKAPDGFESLISYEHPEVDYDEVPEARWWWAATRKPPRKPRKDVYELQAHSSWCAVISDYAPLAKLVAAGLRCRVMLGPELLSIKIRIENSFGLQFIIDGLYAPELVANDIGYWYYITGHDQTRCELSFDELKRPEGWMLDPWEIRLRPKLHDALTSSMEGAAEFIQLTMWRDWSPWILGQRGVTLFERHPRDAKALSMHLGGSTTS